MRERTRQLAAQPRAHAGVHRTPPAEEFFFEVSPPPPSVTVTVVPPMPPGLRAGIWLFLRRDVTSERGRARVGEHDGQGGAVAGGAVHGQRWRAARRVPRRRPQRTAETDRSMESPPSGKRRCSCAG